MESSNSNMSVMNACNKQQSKRACFDIITARLVQKPTKLALLVGALLVLLVSSSEFAFVSSSPVNSAAMNAVVGSGGDDLSHQAGSYNNLENLISDFLDDAGDRLKKSRMNGMRQVKQTLRFGRRSDPWFIPTQSSSERMSIEDLQSRLLAAA